MKRFTPKRIISIISALMALILPVMAALSLSACKYKDPVDQQQEDQIPFGDYDYSKRAFFTGSTFASCIYKGDAYFIDKFCRLKRVSLAELTGDLRTEEAKKLPETYSICTDNTHTHEGGGSSMECPDFLNDPAAEFLLDAYESGGDFPIIYYYRRLSDNLLEEEWDQSAIDEIIRYDTGKMETERIASTANMIKQMMTYDQWVFFVTINAQKVYELNVVSKQGGEVTTVSAGNGLLTLLGAYEERIIFRDDDGAIYQAGLDLQNIQKIFQVSDVKSMVEGYTGEFVHGKYLYYSADYGTVPYPISDDGTQVMNLIKHSVRRVSLDDPQGASEIVADNVLDFYMFGVSDNVFYYSPCMPGKPVQGYYHNFTGGLLKGVDLETLEAVEMKEDTGIDFGNPDAYVSGSALISTAFPVKEGYNITFHDGECVCVYDIKTGALYPLYKTSDYEMTVE